MITQYRLPGEGEDILINIKRSSRRTIGLEVKATGEVLARIPSRLPDKELKNFIEGHKAWIIRKTALVRQRAHRQAQLGIPPMAGLSRKEREAIREKIIRRVQYYSGQMGVTFGRVAVRSQKTRWGSCSSRGNLNFNYKLYYLPEELLDYVVVHELAHRRHMNHSKQFWQEVGKYFPEYRECRKRLKAVSEGR